MNIPAGTLETINRHYTRADPSFRLIIAVLLDKLLAGTATESEREFLATNVETFTDSRVMRCIDSVYATGHQLANQEMNVNGFSSLRWSDNTLYEGSDPVFRRSSSVGNPTEREFRHQLVCNYTRVRIRIGFRTRDFDGSLTHSHLGIKPSDGEILV
jgi:hypothetical protein